jgi:hypothetical protein
MVAHGGGLIGDVSGKKESAAKSIERRQKARMDGRFVTNCGGEVCVCPCRSCEGLGQISGAHGRSGFGDPILELNDLDTRRPLDPDPAPLANEITYSAPPLV